MNTSSRCCRPSTESISKPAVTARHHRRARGRPGDPDQLPVQPGVGPPAPEEVDGGGDVRSRGQTDHGQRIGSGQLGDGPGQDHPAALHDDDVTAGQLDLGEQVAGDDHGPPGGGVVGQDLPHGPDLRRIETVGRFVEQQQRRQPEHRLGDAEALPHALAVAANLPVDGRPEPGDLQGLVQSRLFGRPSGGRPVGPEVRHAAEVRQEAGSLDEGARREPSTSAPACTDSPPT